MRSYGVPGENYGWQGLTSSLFSFFRVFDPVDDEWGAK